MSIISQKKAESIALDFVEQYHESSTIETAFLENNVWVVIARIGLINQQMRKIYIDGLSGQILSYVNGKIEQDDFGINQAKVSFAIEKALLGIGGPAYESVVQKLYETYRCRLFDCYEHPEYLHSVLKEIFGDNYRAIAKSIKNHLKDISSQKSITDFLSVISR